MWLCDGEMKELEKSNKYIAASRLHMATGGTLGEESVGGYHQPFTRLAKHSMALAFEVCQTCPVKAHRGPSRLSKTEIFGI